MRNLTNKDLIREIYWLIGRADPTIEDLCGAAKQVATLIEQERFELAKDVCDARGWEPPPMFNAIELTGSPLAASPATGGSDVE